MSHSPLSFERAVLRLIRPFVAPGDRLLLAVSGGVDSMVLALVMLRLKRLLKVELAVAHVHHGAGRRRRFRDEARARVREFCTQQKIEFFSNRGGVKGGEAAMRAFRLKHLHAWRDHGYSAVVFAHNLDDLLETRMIRLARGTGRQGLEAMTVNSDRALRPLLETSRSEILNYAEARGLKWCEDPSNAETDPLRNWMRHEWLPSLEKKRPGSLPALARSLAHLAEKDGGSETLGECVALRRDLLSSVTLRQQREMVARYLRALGVRGYGQSHVDEILKRLRAKTRVGEFEISGFKFHLSPDFLWASRV